MPKGRLLAFSDGVIAILITIMVLELHTPEGTNWHALGHDLPVLLAYVLSFANVGVYWNNHHHMLTAVHRVSGAALWANLFLLFWLSLIPFATAWMSENHFPTVPVAAYGIVLLANGVAYVILQLTLMRTEGDDSLLARAIGRDVKGKLSVVLYLAAVALAFVDRWIAIALYIAVALMWFIPDPRIERVLSEAPDGQAGPVE
ncbi:TMEM175 family protein [Jatrophihabitans endophyticus]|uniref:TMEM175 family protein n=1 Tax=Jatrophihabitans endophyticus TaxID=1206085 RepID=UPI0019ED7ABF|nr:DUF1211 domain-containing protein [Jatrophihabitans endophyticus]